MNESNHYEFSYQDAIDLLSKSDNLSFDESFGLSQTCSKFLLNSECEHQGRDIVIRIQEAWSRLDPNTHIIWESLTEAYGLYPYIDRDNTELNTDALLRLEYHKSQFLESFYLHGEQQDLSILLHSGKSVVLSAPTSFGKSLLIEELVASKIYKNIVIIQPTLALLDETRKKLSKYSNEYEVILSTSQAPSIEKGNLFLFTGERVVEYGSFPKIDFFIIDEFYKLSLQREDDRAVTLNHAFKKLLRMTERFYLLGPMIKSIPEEFKKKFQLTWVATNFATVSVNEVFVDYNGRLKGTELNDEKKNKLFELLDNLDEPTMIYCSAPERTTKLALEYAMHRLNDFQSTGESATDIDSMIEWIKENINSGWSLIESLLNQVGFHHGALPRHLSSSIVDSFNKKTIKYLFCTSTLIEGVNTSAKNIVLFDKKKGKKNIDFFDYKNIAGRSGRMSQYFVGNVYKFDKQPDQLELEVDIPIITQQGAPLEILIGLDEDEIKPESREKLSMFSSLDKDLQEVLKSNSGMSIEGQLSIIKAIESDLHGYYANLSWTAFPEYEQLRTVIHLGWKNLLSKNENKAGIRNPDHLAVAAFKYINSQSVGRLISEDVNGVFWKGRIPDLKQRIDERTFHVLNMVRHWFDFKLPKWLGTISSLQDYVFTKHSMRPGNYSFIASQIEHGFLPAGMASLVEYDIPVTAVKKLQKFLNADKTANQLLLDLKNGEQLFQRARLLSYETNKIREATKDMRNN